MQKILKAIIYLGLGIILFTPVMMSGKFFFPFIFTKALVFRITVLLVFLAFLFLAIVDKKYRFRITNLTIFLSLYLLIITISSLLAKTFYFSFWGDIERSEGIITWIYLLALFLVVSGFLKSKKEWYVFFDLSFLASLLVALFALGQRLDWQFVLNHGESRLSATIGNPAFLAAYLFFNVFFALILLWVKRGDNIWKWYYLPGILLNLYIIMETATRGVMVGLISSVFLGSFLMIFFTNTNKIVKKVFLGTILFLFLFVLMIFLGRNTSFIQNNNSLRRLSKISLQDRTVQTRLMTWNSAWQGIKEKPILGWGYENFFLIFNKYFNPQIYRNSGSRIWFDRAHNIIFDQLAVGGILGLLVYLSLIFYPIYFLGSWILKDFGKTQAFFRKIWGKMKDEAIIDKKLAIIIVSLLVGYFVQNLFVFDSLVTYIPFIFILAFISHYEKSFEIKFLKSENFYQIFSFILLILFVPILYIVNIKPAKANLTIVEAMRTANKREIESAYNLHLKAISYNTYGNQEYRVRLAEFANTVISKKDGEEIFRRKMALRVKNELKKQIEERPDDVSNYILLMRYYNKIYIYDIELLKDVINKLGPEALRLSPTRPHIYYETGFAKVNLGNYYKTLGKIKEANKLYDEGIEDFNLAIKLNDRVIESYVNAIVMSLSCGRGNNVKIFLGKMDKLNLKYKRVGYLKQMLSAAINTKNYEWAANFAKILTEIDPDNPQHYIDLSLSYVYMGEIDKAVETAEKVKKFGDNYIQMSESFIKTITAPDFTIDKLKSH